MSAVKFKTYLTLFLFATALNLAYQHHFFYEYWMKFKLRNEAVVISFSTTPHRIDKIQPTLESILNQKLAPDAIYLSVPFHFKRDNLAYTIPQWLANHPKVTILRTKDYGPGTKLLGVLEQAKLPANAIIITIDDDAIYPKNFLLELAYKAFLEPDKAVGILGANPVYNDNGIIDIETELGLKKIAEPDEIVSILQGYSGVAYRRKFFDTQIFDILNAPRECINSDDFYLSFYLAKNNITRIVHRNKYINPCKIRWDTSIATNETALHNLHPGPAIKHRACVAYLKEINPDVAF